MKFKYYFFDLDGTLIQTRPLIVECFKHSLNWAAGLSYSEDEINKNIGLPLPDQLMFFLKDADTPYSLNQIMEEHMRFQLEHWKDYIKLYPGADKVLKTLKKSGTNTALITSRRYESTMLYTRELGLLDDLDFIVTPESTEKKKPHPMPCLHALKHFHATASQTLFIGDAPFDMDCAYGAGVKTAYVSYAHTPVKNLNRPPDYIIDRLDEILTLR